MKNKGIWARIEKMMRNIERRWLLRQLRRRIIETSTENPSVVLTGQLHAHLKIAPKGVFGEETGFIGWAAGIALMGFWEKDGNGHSNRRWLDVRRWWWKYKVWSEKDGKKRDELRDYYFNERVILYTELIDESVRMGYVFEAPFNGHPGYKVIRTTAEGATYIAEFWHKATWNNTIGTGLILAVIGGVLTWFVTYRVQQLFKPQQNQIYQIQIIPYATGTIIK